MTSGQVSVGHVDGDVYEIHVRGHRLTVDQPVEAGGTDKAATPTELFAASLAACVAFYAGRYLDRHGHDRTGLRVHAAFDMATDRPARVAAIRITVHPPAGFPTERIPALTAVAGHCTVHNSLVRVPEVAVSVR
ncbi:OsmC family protein [Actinoplanes awajinensis]|uniref:Osmotically inducible protein OsmC n=1 Tax=Actinoplanes awajinensis subsp. mycoplanecinus TaxID=135947 RepID=A0A117MNC1_9ACTN|nr:OsmC family protein [Actinoplanes awajinensis]KUL26919.1 osmotically inducible protein OsmC [Actinoplanes awajinensis subsp. mycoplanecinus]